MVAPVPTFHVVDRQRPFVPVPVVVTFTVALMEADGTTVTLVAPYKVADVIVLAAKTDLGKAIKKTTDKTNTAKYLCKFLTKNILGMDRKTTYHKIYHALRCLVDK